MNIYYWIKEQQKPIKYRNYVLTKYNHQESNVRVQEDS